MKDYTPVFIWALIILFLSINVGINLPESIWDFIAWDKLAHAVVYAILSFLILRAERRLGKKNEAKISFWAIIGCSFYGVCMEVMQYLFFPNRYFELMDILANIIGAIIGAYIFKIFFKIYKSG